MTAFGSMCGIDRERLLRSLSGITLGAAVLLGTRPVTAVDLDGTEATENAPIALQYAVESFFGADITVTDIENTGYYTLVNPSNTLRITTATRRYVGPDERMYVRLKLTGLVFKDASSDVADTSLEIRDAGDNSNVGGANAISYTDRTFGGAGQNVIVFRLNHSSGIPVDSRIVFDVSNDLAAPAMAGGYSATIKSYNDPIDAIEGLNAIPVLDGNAVVVQVVSGLEAKITVGKPLIASLDSDFLRFVGPTSVGRLGTFQVMAKNPRDVDILAADDGRPVQNADIISEAADAVSFTVEGDLSVGAFSVVGLKDDDLSRIGAFGESRLMDCPSAPEGASVDNPQEGTLTMEEGDSTSGTQRLAAGTYGLCVNVDVAGADTNTTQLPEGEYTATVLVTLKSERMQPIEAVRGVIGEVEREGFSVHFPYLTAYHKYNQRLIIVNRGAKTAYYSLGEFATEADTSVELSAEASAAKEAGSNMVGPGELVVLRMGRMLTFTGEKRRTAGTLKINAYPNDISVTTSQVNLIDRGTDTVVYH